jgi:hypothetical protein
MGEFPFKGASGDLEEGEGVLMGVAFSLDDDATRIGTGRTGGVMLSFPIGSAIGL